MSISAKEVKALRDKTGVGMMDCKKALIECDGDMDKAADWLREKGLASAAKRAGRSAADGKVMSRIDDANHVAVIAEINCETDFVAKTDGFSEFADGIMEHLLANKPKTLEELDGQKYKTGETVSEALKAVIAKTGENMKISRFEIFEGGADSGFSTYIHMGGKIGVILQANVKGEAKDAEELGRFLKDMCMQVTAANPMCISPADFPADTLAKEKEIFAAQARESGKPEKIIDKIVEGRVRKLMDENCLLNQQYVKNDELTVAKHLEATAKELGVEIEIERFARYALGEAADKD